MHIFFYLKVGSGRSMYFKWFLTSFNHCSAHCTITSLQTMNHMTLPRGSCISSVNLQSLIFFWKGIYLGLASNNYWKVKITNDLFLNLIGLILVRFSWQVGNFMHYISRFITGFIIGFIRVWQISLVTLSIVPLIAIAGGVYAFVAFGLIARVRKSYVSAGEIAQEVSSLYLHLHIRIIT